MLTCNLCGKTHTSRAMNTSGHHSLHQWPQILVMHRALHLCESASIAAKVHGLQGQQATQQMLFIREETWMWASQNALLPQHSLGNA